MTTRSRGGGPSGPPSRSLARNRFVIPRHRPVIESIRVSSSTTHDALTAAQSARNLAVVPCGRAATSRRATRHHGGAPCSESFSSRARGGSGAPAARRSASRRTSRSSARSPPLTVRGRRRTPTADRGRSRRDSSTPTPPTPQDVGASHASSAPRVRAVRALDRRPASTCPTITPIGIPPIRRRRTVASLDSLASSAGGGADGFARQASVDSTRRRSTDERRMARQRAADAHRHVGQAALSRDVCARPASTVACSFASRSTRSAASTRRASTIISVDARSVHARRRDALAGFRFQPGRGERPARRRRWRRCRSSSQISEVSERRTRRSRNGTPTLRCAVPASASRCPVALLVPQRDDRIERRRATRRPHAERHADERRERERHDDRGRRDLRRPARRSCS